MKKGKRIIKTLTLIIVISSILTAVEIYNFQKKRTSLKNTSADPGQIAAKISADNQSNMQNISDHNQLNNNDSDEADPLPSKYLLDMPFYSQAPFGNWDKVHEEMCEEASVLNAGLYLLDKNLSDVEYEKELMVIKKLEENIFDDYKSTTIAQTKKFTDEYFSGKIRTKTIDNPTIEEIENEIAAGNPVIVPLAGRDIGNPNFTPPGPVYHMLVVKGYDSQSFITNDVGTRKGNSYTYKKEVIMKNIHDWDKMDIHRGIKRVLVLQK